MIKNIKRINIKVFNTIYQMKNTFLIACLIFFIISCSNGRKSKENSKTSYDVNTIESSEITLFLTSSSKAVSSKLVTLLPFKPTGRTVCYITTASHPDGDVPTWINEEIEGLENMGFKVISIDLATLEHDDLEKTFSECDLFWVCGGNTLYLLQEVRRSGFDNFVKKKISEGIPYVGSSAGSILLGPDIEFERLACDITQAPNLTSFEGLNIFPFSTYVHFDAPWAKDVYKDILKFSLDNNKSFITLRDNQFIHVKGETWQVIDVD
jgi:dipeptidase E